LMCGQVQVPSIPMVVEKNCTYTFTMYSCDACRNPSTCSNEEEDGFSRIIHNNNINNNKVESIEEFVLHRQLKEKAKKLGKFIWN